MLLREIMVPVSSIRGVGPATAKPLASLGLVTVGDVLAYWPRDWEDRTVFHALSEYNTRAKLHVRAMVVAHDWFGYGRMRTLKIMIRDEAGTVAELACFNRPFLEKQFPPGTPVAVYGSFRYAYGSLQSSSFEIEPVQTSPARVLPVYSLTAGISQQQMRKIMTRALSEYGRGIDSELPETIRNKYNIPSKQDVVHAIHEPQTLDQAHKARQALIFEELFLFEYAIGQRSLERRGRLPRMDAQSTGNSFGSDESANIGKNPTPLQVRLIERLPFHLTPDQHTILHELNGDIDSPTGMARLLQGDVGSGKTLLAFLASLAVCERGGQTAILAPTELLARQHAENAAKLLEPAGIRIAFLTGNLKSRGRATLLKELSAGRIDVVIGTHALFSRNVHYHNLRLVVIDEQQRFGVLQRSAIIEKGRESDPGKSPPHLLMMSATPIPRTLALSVFGDLDVSVLRTMPPGRKPVITHLAAKKNEKKVYDFIRRELKAGKQAYFVYPLIDPSDSAELASATDMAAHLADHVFPEYECALIHSRIPEDEQKRIMDAFRSGSVQILVATSVVEVGVDVPNATCMVIEHAERFGLSALHQLRGRVGRGSAQSYCFLIFSDKLTDSGKARLRVMHETTDGFIIAEEDLKLRGPGDIAGIQQSGYISFTLADPVRDFEILQEARIAAFDLLETASPHKKPGASSPGPD